MKNFLTALLIVAIIVAVLFIFTSWNTIQAWFNPSKQPINNTPAPPSCQQQLDDAKAEFAKSGQSCVQTVADVVCPSDSTFIASVDPCIEKLLKDKGWTNPVQQNNSGNSGGNNNSSSQYNLQVSNPNGAFMYYKMPTNTPGVFQYSKSNLLIPAGTTLNKIGDEVNTYQGLPAKVIETTYKQYGDNSGFFDVKDIIKI